MRAEELIKAYDRKTIDPRELRLGNAVNYYGAQIFVNEDDLKCIIDGGKGNTAIPLTEEWLIKAGFEKDKYDVWSKESWFGFCNTDIGGFSVISLKDSFFIKVIYHVHQLQNLFYALTGEELTWHSEAPK